MQVLRSPFALFPLVNSNYSFQGDSLTLTRSSSERWVFEFWKIRHAQNFEINHDCRALDRDALVRAPPSCGWPQKNVYRANRVASDGSSKRRYLFWPGFRDLPGIIVQLDERFRPDFCGPIIHRSFQQPESPCACLSQRLPMNLKIVLLEIDDLGIRALVIMTNDEARMTKE